MDGPVAYPETSALVLLCVLQVPTSLAIPSFLNFQDQDGVRIWAVGTMDEQLPFRHGSQHSTHLPEVQLSDLYALKSLTSPL